MLEALLGDRYWEQADYLFKSWSKEARSVNAPALFYAEVTSTITERVYRRSMPRADADFLLRAALNWPIIILDDVRSIQASALEFATRFNRPKAYDAQYLAVAHTLGCELWTSDRRLVNAVGDKLPWVRWIGEGA